MSLFTSVIRYAHQKPIKRAPYDEEFTLLLKLASICATSPRPSEKGDVILVEPLASIASIQDQLCAFISFTLRRHNGVLASACHNQVVPIAGGG